MKISLRDYFHALNVLNVETDVNVDGADDGCAVVAPIKLTPKGEKEWGGLLDNKDLYVDVEEYGNCIMSDNDKDYEQIEDSCGNLYDALSFIWCLAGYCPANKFNEWFEGEDAKLI